MHLNINKWWLILLGSALWSLTMIKSGLLYSYGLGFWGPNGHDGVWHLALIESLAKGSWQMPVFAGESLRNYHVGFDLLLAAIHRLSGLPTPLLYFQLTPPLLAILIGWLSYKFIKAWTKSDSAALWAVFFVYFGGSLGWLLGRGESAFWSQQAISTLVNPPFALSVAVLLGGLMALQQKRWWAAVLLLGLVFQVKVYAGILVAVGLIVAAVYKRSKQLLLVWAGTAVLGGVLLSLTAGSAGKLVVWQPGWFLETMMGLSDRVNWPQFYSAMTNYRLGGQWLKAIAAYLVAFAIFWIGNMGTRISKELLVFSWAKKWRFLGWEEVFMATVIIAGGLLPMVFLQAGTPWNTIQFFYYALFFSGLLAGIAVAKMKSLGIKIAIVLLTLPTTWQTLHHYLPTRPPAMLPNTEIAALQFLAAQPPGVVLTYPYDPVAAKAAEASPPRPLYLYESTAYVAAFSQQPVYLEDEVNLNITGFAWQDRRQQANNFFTTTTLATAHDFLTTNHIQYLYLANVAKNRPVLGQTELGLRSIYENSQVAIWAR